MESERIIFYSEHARELEGSVGAKIQAILDQNAIEYDSGAKVFLCKPIMQKNGKPYNKTTHMMKADKELGFVCSCMGYQMRMKKHLESPFEFPAPNCSHVAALHEHLKRQHRERRVMQGIQLTLGEG